MASNSPISIVDVGKLRESRLEKLLVVGLRGSKKALVWSYQLAALQEV